MMYRLGEKIKTAMEERNITQRQLSIMSRVSERSIRHIICGDYDPSVESLAKICAALNLDANVVLGIKR